MPDISLGELRSTFANKCGANIEAAVLKSVPSQFSSPDLLDLVFWNVVIGFVISFASNVAAMKLPRKSTLTHADLQAIRQIMQVRAEIPANLSRDSVSEAIRTALPAKVSDADKLALSDQLADAVLDKLRHV